MSNPLDLSQIVVANIVLDKINYLPTSIVQYHILPYLLNQGRILFKEVVKELNLIFSEDYNILIQNYWNLPPIFFLSISAQIDNKEPLYLKNTFDRIVNHRHINFLQANLNKRKADQLLNNTPKKTKT